MITAPDLQISALRRALPKNNPNPSATVLRDFPGRSEEIRAWQIAQDMAKVLHTCYQTVLKIPYHEVAVANHARHYLPDWVKLHNWLEAACLSPVLFLRAQVTILKRKIQPRGMWNEKALRRYEIWLENLRYTVDTPGQALAKLAKLESVKWRSALQNYIMQAVAGRQYVGNTCKAMGLSMEAVVCLESWHLPPAYFLAEPAAFGLYEAGAVDVSTSAKIKAAAKELTRRGELDKFLNAVHA